MLTTPDYTQMTLEELLAAEKAMKSRRTITALFVGFVVGIGFYAATRGKGLFFVVLLFGSALWFGKQYDQGLKKIQAEIERRNGV